MALGFPVLPFHPSPQRERESPLTWNGASLLTWRQLAIARSISRARSSESAPRSNGPPNNPASGSTRKRPTRLEISFRCWEGSKTAHSSKKTSTVSRQRFPAAGAYLDAPHLRMTKKTSRSTASVLLSRLRHRVTITPVLRGLNRFGGSPRFPTGQGAGSRPRARRGSLPKGQRDVEDGRRKRRQIRRGGSVAGRHK